jgi:hypothetical protein
MKNTIKNKEKKNPNHWYLLNTNKVRTLTFSKLFSGSGEGKKRKFENEMDPTYSQDKYSFKLDINIGSEFYNSGRFISTDIPRVTYCSPSLRVRRRRRSFTFFRKN